MFSITKSTYTGNNKILIEAVCLADDSKPTTGIANGSMCIVMEIVNFQENMGICCLYGVIAPSL